MDFLWWIDRSSWCQKKYKTQLPHHTFNSIIFCRNLNGSKLDKDKCIPMEVSKLLHQSGRCEIAIFKKQVHNQLGNYLLCQWTKFTQRKTGWNWRFSSVWFTVTHHNSTLLQSLDILDLIQKTSVSELPVQTWIVHFSQLHYLLYLILSSKPPILLHLLGWVLFNLQRRSSLPVTSTEQPLAFCSIFIMCIFPPLPARTITIHATH